MLPYTLMLPAGPRPPQKNLDMFQVVGCSGHFVLVCSSTAWPASPTSTPPTGTTYCVPSRAL